MATEVLEMLANLGKVESLLLELLRKLFADDVTEPVVHYPEPDQCFQHGGSTKLVGFIFQTPIEANHTYFVRFYKFVSGSYVATASNPPPQLTPNGYEGSQFLTLSNIPFLAANNEYLVKLWKRSSTAVETELANRRFYVKASCGA